jgi:type VI secretion system VasD/TssJ family lipoprotein
MKRSWTIILLLLFSLALASCSSRSRGVERAGWEYEKEAVRIHLEGDPQLNRYKGKSHTLVVCVYNLKDLNGFNQLADGRGGLPELLECNRFDPGVTYAKRLIVQPGKDTEEILDRTEGTRYVGLVAGYYSLNKANSVRIYEIPTSLFNNPKKMDIRLHMGPEGIEKAKEKK